MSALNLIQDSRFAIRTLLKSPGFALTAVVTLALGIGANTAIFSVVYGVLLAPLPYWDAERIAVAGISPPDYRDLQATNDSFDQLAIWASNLYNLSTGGDTVQVTGAIVSSEFFPMLGQPTLGRAWTTAEDDEPLVVISHDLWRKRLGGRADAIGQTLRLSGEVLTIIGVMGPEFQYPSAKFQLWTTFGAAMAKTPQQAENRQLRIFRAVAHLRPGVTFQQMQAEAESFSLRQQAQYPETNAGVRITFTPLQEIIIGDVRPALRILLAVVGFILLIGCASVANLLLARTTARQRELAVRIALGAGRWCIVRQMLTESLLLAMVGGLIAVLLAMWGLDVLARLGPGSIPRLSTIGVNLPVLAFTLAVSVLTGLGFGLGSAWQAARGDLMQSLKDGGRGAAGGTGGRRLRGALVVAEVALSTVVLTGAGLLLRSFLHLVQVDAGFVAENLLTGNVGLVEVDGPARRAEAQRRIIEGIARLPGVEAVGGGSALPPDDAQRVTRFAVQGRPDDDGAVLYAYFIAISPGYFRALGTPLIAGRLFTEGDGEAGAGVVIISRTLAETIFPDESPVGRRVRLINPEQTAEWREIVGVVGDVHYNGLGDSDLPTIYTPFAQTPFLWSYLMVRTSVPPQTVAAGVRRSIAEVDPTLEAADLAPMSRRVRDSVAQPRFYAALLGAFAAVALALAAVGLYGVLAFSVMQRTREIGVRMALGAARRDVLRLVIRQGLWLTLIGVSIGVAAAYGLTRLMASLLFEVSATDPATFAGVATILSLVALAACWIPARRALRVDPLVALRYE